MVLIIAELPVPSFALDAIVRVEPQQVSAYQTETFTVNITLLNVQNTIGWEVKLCWNRTIINCTTEIIHVPNEWTFNYTLGPGIQWNYNATHGRYYRALCGIKPSSPFNGSMPLSTLTFKALGCGMTTLDLCDSVLADNQAGGCQPIPHLEYDANVNVLPPPLYMRSDQHTVNNATMYKLMDTHTGSYNSTSTSSIDPENEWVCFWGMRAWKRSGNGTETEITVGSPVAQVSRATSGQGLQYATWNCSATNLCTTDCLVVRVYYSFDVGYWIQCAQFCTTQLNATSLSSQTWTVYYYTSRSYDSQQHKTYMYYYWDNNYNSRLENINCS